MTRRRSFAGLLLRLFAVVFLLLAAVGALAYYSLQTPYRGFDKPVILDFPIGTTSGAMSDELAAAGVIHHRFQFLLARALDPGAKLQAGEYQFAKPASVWEVYHRIVRGDVFYYELTIPEGSNMFDVAAAVDRLGFLKGGDFLKVARDPAPIRDLAPGAPSLEGYLFPSTYRVTRRTSVRQLCGMMTDLFRKHWRELQDPTHPVVVNDTVTLASLIEKETAIPEERPLVASVYRNRLNLGMQLDCDPTTIYAALVEGRYRGTIYRSDLDSEHPYNTYRHPGLPPGPIANPGLASLKAALAPAPTNYLYFVAKADGSGGHNFSSTIGEHNRAVVAYRHAAGKPTAPDPPAVHPQKHHSHSGARAKGHS